MNRKKEAAGKGTPRKTRTSGGTYFVIMAGGKGERFWPLSTGLVPKPFVSITGKKTLIELTVERALRIAPLERIFVVLGREHLPAAKKCLPRLPRGNFIIEPVGRDTAPCVGLAAMMLHRRDPDAVMVVLPSDHYVPDPAAFSRCIRETVKTARRGDHLVTIGVPPGRPETGYGYIRTGRKISAPRDADCFEVARYVEKPNLAKARRYLREGGYFWNAGIFVWRVSVLLEGLRTHMPDLHAGLLDFYKALDGGDRDRADAIFAALSRISIDYGLMEKAKNVLMMPAPFAWDDVGTWTSLLRVLPRDETGNVLRGRTVTLDTDNCVIITDTTPVATLGASNLVIIASKNGILICDASRAQEVRQIAKALGKKQ
ncbi:MAG: Alginate biosynthesis protein AlgA [Syntrophorhabdus sp. PtaB.Bin047]|nr:MAG: Alginate biosynthesis protein AlgA [Syntrophorhabdus sp. PtaB.Bin047]